MTSVIARNATMKLLELMQTQTISVGALDGTLLQHIGKDKMDKTAGYDDPCYGQDPYDEKQEQIDLANERELERITHEIITNLKRSGIDKEHGISLLDVFDDMVLTGIDYRLHDVMIIGLYALYRQWPPLTPLINKHIDDIARITAEHELEKS